MKLYSILEKKSGDRVAAKGFPFAGLAVFAYPNRIELVHGLLNQLGIVGKDASLEIAGAIAFHADACAELKHRVEKCFQNSRIIPSALTIRT